jgi:hypothetical protein
MHSQTEPLSIDELNDEITEAIKTDEAKIDKRSGPVVKKVSPALKQIDLYWLRHPSQLLKTIVSRPDKTIGMKVHPRPLSNIYLILFVASGRFPHLSGPATLPQGRTTGQVTRPMGQT